MEKIVSELKKLIKFKDVTAVGDIVLVVAKNPQMLAYAVVTDIQRDTTKRDEWWHVTMQILAVPPQDLTWILRTDQLTGQEIFTMDGEERFVKALDISFGPRESPPAPPSVKKKSKPVLRVLK